MNNEINLKGHTLNVKGNTYINGSDIKLSKGTFICEGNLECVNVYRNSAYIYMTDEDDSAIIYGNFTCNSYYGSSYMTAGTLEIKGNFTQNTTYSDSNFTASGTHKVIFSGDKKQTITFASSKSYFNIVEIQNHSEDGVYCTSGMGATEIITNNCNLTYTGNERLGWTLTDNLVIDGDLTLVGGTLDLAGYDLTVAGSFIQKAGTVFVNHGTLTVNNDYRIQTPIVDSENYDYSHGILKMTSNDDHVIVGGTFATSSNKSHSGKLTAGVLEIGGDFYQYSTSSHDNFNCSNDFTVKLCGTKKQIIKFERPLESRITNIIFDNSSNEGVKITDYIYITDSIIDSCRNVNGFVKTNSLTILDSNSFSGSVELSANNTISEDYNIGGTLRTTNNFDLNGQVLNVGSVEINDGTFTLNGGSVNCANNFTINYYGRLSMINESDHITVGGNFKADSIYSHSSFLTNGVLEIKGDFSQSRTADSFLCSGNHHTILSGKSGTSGRIYKQTVKFSNPGSSKFNKLTVTRPLSYYSLNASTDVICNELHTDIRDIEAPTKVNGLAAGNVGVTTVSLSWIPSTDNIKVLGYEVYRNNEKVATVTNAAFNDSKLSPDTTYVYKVRAFDEMRNVSEYSDPVSITTSSDTNAPEIPRSVRVKYRTARSITINWLPSTDNVECTGYKIFRDNQEIATVSENVYKDSSIVFGTEYSYKVKAVDAAGNTSDFSESVSAHAVKPVITSVTPAEYTVIGSGQSVITVRYQNTGNSIDNKVKFEYSSDGESWKTISQNLIGQQTYSGTELYSSYTWDTSKLTSGEYTVKCTLYDADDYAVERETVYYIDNSAPAVVSNVTATTQNAVITVQWTRSSDSDCTSYNLYRAEGTGEYVKIKSIDSADTVAYTDKDVSENTLYSYYVTSVDAFGHESAPSTAYSVTSSKDEEKPYITSILTPKRINATAKVQIVAHDNLAVSHIQLQYYDAENSTWTDIGTSDCVNNKATISWDTTLLDDGVYQTRAYVWDIAGNKSVQEFTESFTIDNTGPSKIVLSETTATSSTVSIRWNDVTENDFAYFQVEQKIDNEFVSVGTEDNVLGMHIKGLNPNTTYQFRVVGYDNLGNRGIPSDVTEITTTADNVNPYIDNFAPAQSYFRNKINLAITAKDNCAVSGVKLYYSTDKETWQKITELTSDNSTTEHTFQYEFNGESMDEGVVYFKATAVDGAGNESAPIMAAHCIDRTAPQKITDLRASDETGYVSLNWTALDNDIEYFVISRADEDNGIYSDIETKWTAKNYYDTNVEYGKVYSYRIKAVDAAGNISDLSNETIIQVSEDTAAPEIFGVTPNTDSVVGQNTKISVVAYDARLNTVYVEYKKKNTSDIWSELGRRNSINGSYEKVEFDWNTVGLADGEYEFRAYAIDKNNNTSDAYTFEYVLDNTAPAKPNLELTRGDYQIRLDWNQSNEDDFSYYLIYRKSEPERDFSVIKQTGVNSYIDKDVTPGVFYSYKVEAYDKCGNNTVSDMKLGYAENNDTEPPTAVVPDEIIAIVGQEIVLDGTESYDNVRIKSFSWNMGNNETATGARSRYTYNTAGSYTAELTVTDTSDNTNSAEFTITVLDQSNAGVKTFKLINKNNEPIRNAYVYMYSADGDNKNLRADSEGFITVAGELGEQKIAVYKEGYLPKEHIFTIESVANPTIDTIVLDEGEVVVGDFSVHRMTLEEMIEAGIDISSPDNYNSFSFEIELKFEEASIPTIVKYINAGGGSGGHIVNIDGGKSSVIYSPGGGSLQIQAIDLGKYSEEIEEPIFYYIRRQEKISWMKEMFCAELGIFNTADPKFVLDNSSATLSIPSGLSLVNTSKGQSLTQSMGSIKGKETKSVQWYIRGDKRGEYNLTASFFATLMPFNAPINVSFMTEEPFTVEGGKGLHLYIYPEAAAYKQKEYYIQYELKNESGRDFYHIKTTFGKYTIPDQENDINIISQSGSNEVISPSGQEFRIPNEDPLTSLQSGTVPLLTEGDSVSVDVLAPGESLKGTYKEKIKWQGEMIDSYFKLIDYVVKEIGESNTGLEVTVSPISSHITKYNLRIAAVGDSWADPVNMTTGAFTDSINAITLNGNPSLSLDLSYNSLNTEKGECGYGWTHGYESKIVYESGYAKLYLNSESFITFISDDIINRNVQGELVDGQIIISNNDNEGEMSFTCVSSGMSDYDLCRNADGTYTLNFPDGTVWNYDSEGRLTQMIQPSGRLANISYGNNSMTVSEPIGNKFVTLNYSDSGLLTSVTDNTGRAATFAYEDDCLIRFTNALGQSVEYTYDENNRIISEKNNSGITFVVNTYDDEGRVVSQDDALSDTPLTYFSYNVDEEGNTITNGTDRNGNNIVFKSDSFGHVTEMIDRNGHSTLYEYDDSGNLISETNAIGGTTTYSYDDKGRVISVKDCAGNITQMSYDDASNLISLTSPLGTVNSYTYNSANYMTSSTESTGRTKTYSYDSNGMLTAESTTGLGTLNYSYTNGLLTSASDYKGQTVSRTYDSYGNLSQETYADNTTTVYTYDALGRQTSITDSTGGTISYTYDVYGNIATATDANGGVTSYVYNDNNLLVSSADTRGSTTLYEYDNEGNNTKITHPDGTFAVSEFDAEGNITKKIDEAGGIYLYAYDAANNLISETLPNGSTSTHEYYPNGKEKKTTYSDGRYISYSYDALWRVTQTVDNLGNTYKYQYDNYNNVTKIIDPLDNFITNEYDVYGRLISSTDANGNTTAYEYDANGNCVKKTNPNGLVSTITYDSRNRPVTVTAKSEYGDYSISYAYDALGRVTSYTDEEGNVFQTEYDHLGNITAVIDAKGNYTSRAEYDSTGNVTKATDALGVFSQYSYDSTGNLTSTTNDVGTTTQSATTYSYDALDRLISTVDPENGTNSYTYDSVGNITSVTDPNGGTSTYTYDSMGRMTASVNAIGSRNTYTYNAAGLLSQATNAKNQSTTYQYDALGRITSFTDNLGTVSYTYDANGNVLTVTDSSGTITREYDSMNRVTKYTDARGNVVRYGYDTLGNLVTLTYPGGEIVRYSYYPTGRLKTVTDWNNKVTNYEYDGNGRITKLSRPDGSVETCEYDANGRLTKQTDVNGEKVINSFTYTYDTAGNIINLASQTEAEDTVALQSASMEYDAANRLIKYNNEDVLYDADGNMTYGPLNGVMTSFTYDCRNRLVSEGNTTYAYDAENNRISVTVGSTTTSYVVENNSGELSKILSSTTGNKTTLFIYGSGLLAQNDVDNGYLYYHFNNIGSTTAITDSDGKIKYAFSYGTYGELLSGDTHGIMFLYNGQYGVVTDSNGLYYMRARYYNVDIKRFINQDVVEGSITNSPSLNKYAYCQGNPVSLLDPFGLSPQSSVSTGGHLILDALGFIPALGAIPDIINAVWYLAEGNYAYAAMSAIAAIPGLGDGFGLFAEGTKYACMFKKVMFGLGVLGNANRIKDSLNGISDISKYLFQKHFVDGADWDMDSAYAAQEGLFLVAQTLIDFVGLGKNLEGFKNSQCFVAGTLVLTIDGNKPIEEIKAGDLVYSTNPETGESEYKEVVRAFRKESDVIIHIFVHGEEIETTPDHPFWVENQWVLAKDLREGDVLTLADGTTATITRTYGEQLDEPVIVYNFEVTDFHTYYVTSTGILVHNANKTYGNDGVNTNGNKEKGVAEDFEKSIQNLSPSERVATVKEKAKQIAQEAGLVKDSRASKINGRDIYKDLNTGKYYSVDTQHGRFELLDKRGNHLGEMNFDFNFTKPADTSGKHNVKVK